MDYMFNGLQAAAIYLGDKFDTNNVKSMYRMFNDCRVSKVYIGNNVSQSSIDKMVNKGSLKFSVIIRDTYQTLNNVSTMFAKNDLANSMKNVLKSSRTALMSLIKPTTSYAEAPKVVHSGTMGTTTWEIFDNRELVLRPTSGSVGEFKVTDYSGNYAPWHDYEGTFAKIRVEGTVRPKGVLYKNGCGFFQNSQAKEINLQGFDTSNVTDMDSMFYNSSAQTINLGNKFDTSNVKSMYQMFLQSQAILIDLGNRFDTAKVTIMNGMFQRSQATFINLGDKFNTSNVKDMRFMFFDSKVITIDLGDKFDTNSVTDMYCIFSHSCANKIYIPSSFKFKGDHDFDDGITYDSSKYLNSWSREDKTYTNIAASAFESKFNANPSAMTILKYKDDMNKTIPRGRIVIDRIGVNLRIYEGLNNANLLRGACEQIPRYEMKMGDVGNYVLAAHCSRYNKHFMFSSIRYLKHGDEIKVSDNENVYVYKVTFVKKVSKEDTSFINEKADEKLITLYTCDDVYRFYPRNRIVVRGTLDRVYKR